MDTLQHERPGVAVKEPQMQPSMLPQCILCVVVSVTIALILLLVITGTKELATNSRLSKMDERVRELAGRPLVDEDAEGRLLGRIENLEEWVTAIPDLSPVLTANEKRVSQAEAGLAKADMYVRGEVKILVEAITARHQDIMNHEVRMRRIESTLKQLVELVNNSRKRNASRPNDKSGETANPKKDRPADGHQHSGSVPKVSSETPTND